MTNDKYGVPHTYVADTLDEIGSEFEADMLAAGFDEVHVYTNTRDGIDVLLDDEDEVVLEQVVEEKEDADNAAVIADAVAEATLTTWSDIHGHVRDAICIPHPPGEDACWGDYPAETIEAIEAGAVARLAPGRKVVDGAGDQGGDYLILSEEECNG